MKKISTTPPRKRKNAEVIVKRKFGLGAVFGDGGIGLYEGIAVIGNRRGYRFLSDYFRWLAERPTRACESDPGDHVHLTPTCRFSDEIDFTFDTLTGSNRMAVLCNAGADERSKLRGTPFQQFTRIVTEIIDSNDGFLTNDDTFRQSIIRDIGQLIDVLEQKRASLERK